MGCWAVNLVLSESPAHPKAQPISYTTNRRHFVLMFLIKWGSMSLNVFYSYLYKKISLLGTEQINIGLWTTATRTMLIVNFGDHPSYLT